MLNQSINQWLKLLVSSGRAHSRHWITLACHTDAMQCMSYSLPPFIHLSIPQPSEPVGTCSSAQCMASVVRDSFGCGRIIEAEPVPELPKPVVSFMAGKSKHLR